MKTLDKIKAEIAKYAVPAPQLQAYTVNLEPPLAEFLMQFNLNREDLGLKNRKMNRTTINTYRRAIRNNLMLNTNRSSSPRTATRWIFSIAAPL